MAEIKEDKQKSPRLNYRIGQKFEKKTADMFRALGYTVIRSWASRSPFDLVCIALDKILLVQVAFNQARNFSGGARLDKMLNVAVPAQVFKLEVLWFDEEEEPVVRHLDTKVIAKRAKNKLAIESGSGGLGRKKTKIKPPPRPVGRPRKRPAPVQPETDPESQSCE
jgi:hypothetical protein